MSLSHQYLRRLTGVMIFLSALWFPERSEAATAAQTSNPISRIARLFNSQLVKVEDRVNWLDSQVSTYARHCEYPLRTNLGYRGGRTTSLGKDPTITLDLGGEMPVDQIFLVPAQREFLQDSGIFPKRFTLEVSKQADFSASTVVYRSGDIPFVAPDGTPALFQCRDVARYVRLTVQEGHLRESEDLFGLAEFVVISRAEPVSFGATVETTGALNVPELWLPEALIDGRTLLESGRMASARTRIPVTPSWSNNRMR